MRLEQINDIAMAITNSGENKSAEVYFKLDEHKHEVLQQEVYKFINKTIHGYSSKKSFEIIISDVRFIFKRG
jgi:hypothetical protein